MASSILTPEAMLAASTARTGLDDFGDPGFREGLDRLLAEIDGLGLSDAHIAASAGRIGQSLDARALAVSGLKVNPEVLEQPIRQPLIIAGLVRSGTTALHHLMSLDPQFQGPENWLTTAPMPRPPRECWEEVPAYVGLRDAMRVFAEAAPEMVEDHMMSAEGIEESLFILASGFASNMWPSMWPVPHYDLWYRSRDDTDSYRWLADVLRLIGKGDPRPWLLKNPTDLFSLAEVLRVYPDAMIVQTHRDPVEAIPSISSLILAARRVFCGDLARAEDVGQREAEFWASALERAHRVRSGSNNRFFDVEFDGFVRDQLGTVKAIYAFFGLTLTNETEAAMQAWLDAHPRRPSGRARYRPEDFGLSEDGLAEQYRTYRQRRGYDGCAALARSEDAR